MMRRTMAILDSTSAPRLPGSALSMPRWAEVGGGCPRVLRLGLATRGNTSLGAEDVAHAVGRGVNYLNWCGYDDAIAAPVQVVRAAGAPRSGVFGPEGRVGPTGRWPPGPRPDWPPLPGAPPRGQVRPWWPQPAAGR